MFSGLFKTQATSVKRNPPQSQKIQAAGQTAGIKSKGGSTGTKNGRNPKEKRMGPVVATGKVAKSKELRAPQNGLTRIKMTDDEAAAFMKWREEHLYDAGVKKRKRAETAEPDAPPSPPARPTDSLSKKARKKLRLQMARQKSEVQAETDELQEKTAAPAETIEKLSKKARKKLRKQQLNDKPHASESAKQPSQLQKPQGQSAAARLQGSRFRWLNEMLYSSTGKEAKDLYENDPTLAAAYHEGFREQARKWPRNPLDDIIKWLLKEVPADKVVGDFGCGDARLASELKGRTVHSFDLVKINERVTPCNLAAVPLKDHAIDVAVFCLALMGTDWPVFVTEAHRCLRLGGILEIVEVESRIKDLNEMIRMIEAIGFQKVVVKPTSFFTSMRFEKAQASKSQKNVRSANFGGDILARCEYRRR